MRAATAIRGSLQVLAVTAALITVVVVLARTFDHRRDPAYDPIATMAGDELTSSRRNHRDLYEFRYLIQNFGRFKPMVAKWAKAHPNTYGHEIAIDAAFAAERPGIEFLMVLTSNATPAQRAELVRQLGIHLHYAPPTREEVRAFLIEIEAENTMAGYFAYLGLATSDYRYPLKYSREDREQKFIAAGLDPYRDADEVGRETGWGSPARASDTSRKPEGSGQPSS